MKAIIFVTAIMIFFLGGVILFDEPYVKAQVPAPKAISDTTEKDFDARLKKVEDKSMRLPIYSNEKVKVVYKTKTKTKLVKPDPETVYFKKDGEVVLDMAIPRDGSLLIVNLDHVDSTISAQDTVELKPSYDFRDTLESVVDEEISNWKKIKSWFIKNKN